jgi:hypothetical protein
VVEHLPRHPKVDGSSPANTVDVGRYNVEKTKSTLTPLAKSSGRILASLS